MKKRVLSLLLVVLMVVSLLPTMAFAADDFTITNGTPESAKETNHGYIAIDKTSAAEGDTVTVTVNPATGYQLKSLTATPVAPTISTIADVLATVEGFPASEDQTTPPSSAWVADVQNSQKCYAYTSVSGAYTALLLRIPSVTYTFFLTTTEVTPGENCYTASNNLGTLKFNMTDGVLTGFEFTADPSKPKAADYVGTYTPASTPSPSLKPITPEKQTDGTYQFKMPGYAVTVTAEFEKKAITIADIIATYENFPLTKDEDLYWTNNQGTTCYYFNNNLFFRYTSTKSLMQSMTVSVAADGKNYTYSDGTVTYTFIMDDSGVLAAITVSGSTDEKYNGTYGAPPTKYTVTNGTTDMNGDIAIDKASAAEGETVTITVTPDEGYQLKADSLKVYKTNTVVKSGPQALPITPMQDTQDKTKYTFTMPAYAVVVVAEFEEVGGTPSGKTLPYSFDFETDMVAEGWTNIDYDGDSQDWITGTTAYAGNGFGNNESECAISQSYENYVGAFNADNWLFSPAITIPAGGATVSWYEQSQDPSYPDFYEVYICGTNTEIDLSKMTKIFSGEAANPWTQRSVELEAAEYAGKTVYIAFRHLCSDCYFLEIDDFAAEAIAPAHTHSFTYTVNNGKLTATCVDGCDDGYDTNPLTLTLTAPASLVYDGNAKAFTFADGEAAAWTGAGLELPTITYYQKYSGQGWYTQLNEVPVNAGGDYMAEIVVNNKAAQVKFTIDKATPYIKTEPAPNDIEYGEKLSDSTLFGGYVQISSTDSTQVGGLFEWTNPDTVPGIDDSEVTEYDVTFTPADTDNFNTVSCKVKIKVNHTHAPVLVNGQAPQKGIAGWKDYYECICGECYEDASGSILIPDLAVWKAEGGNGYLAPLTPAMYTVTFNMGNHGTQIDPQIVEEGNKATKPSDPTAEGWTFDGWYADAAFNVVFDFDSAINANTTIYAKWTENPPAPAYIIIAGANGEWTKSGTTGLAFTSDAPFAKFSSVKIDGSTIAASNYMAEEGSTKITLAPAYLETLSVGTHSIEIVSDDGSASTSFTIKATVPPDPCEGYTDIDRGSWYHSAADFVIERGLMGSTKTDALTFEPDTTVSRAMVASILYRMAGSPAATYKGTFTDVPDNKWYTTAIEWCAQNGLASGKGNGKFDPNGNVTRQELAVFMMKMAEYLGEDTSGRADLGSFADGTSVPAWAKTYLEWAVDAGLISGNENGGKTYLAPTDTATRAEFASIIMRFVQNIAEAK